MLASEISDRRVISDAGDYLAYAAAWLAIGAYLLEAVKTAPKCMFSSLYQIYYFASLLVGTTSVAFGVRMIEIQKPGFANGAFWMMLICFIVTIEAIKFGYKLAEKSYRSPSKSYPSAPELAVAFALVGGIAAISFAILYLYGSPLTSGVNRVLFWSVIAPPFLSPVRILIFLTFFLVCCLAFPSNRRGIATAGRIFLLIYLFLGVVLLGEKASLFIIYLSAFMFVFAAHVENVAITKLGFGLACVAIILMVGAAYVYETSGLGADFVFARLALQAQIPWSVLFEPEAVLADGIGYLGANLDIETLREQISGRYLPPFILAAHSLSGTSLTGFMPTWQILFFGTLGSFLLMIIVCLFLGFVQFHIVQRVRQGQLILSLIIFSAHFQLLSIWYVGNFNVAPILLILLIFMTFIFLSPRIQVGLPKGDMRHA
jgi:hypothetical protein